MISDCALGSRKLKSADPEAKKDTRNDKYGSRGNQLFSLHNGLANFS